MVIFFCILIVLACAALGFFVLIQNPKGGGLSGNVGGVSNQLMGVKQTTDVLEKGTWICAGVVACLAMMSTVFLKVKTVSTNEASGIIQKVNTNAPKTTTVPGK